MTPRIPWPQLKRSLVAILRGIRGDQVEPVVSGLIEAGFEAIEIPLNSPDPFASIATAVKLAPPGVLIGAGTVLDTAAVDRLADVGGRLMVSPNVDPDVIRRAAGHGMVTLPGVLSPTEAFLALTSGASGLKFFPASLVGPSGVKAIKAVLPADTEVGAVGGVSEANFPEWAAAGVRTFGLGSSLFQPSFDAAEVIARAAKAIAVYDEVYGRA